MGKSMKNHKMIEIGPFRIVQINEKTIKIYSEEYMSIYPCSSNTIITSSDRNNTID